MRTTYFVAALLASALLASPASADVRLAIHDGRVTLSARNATVGQILAEWARVGQTRVVNAERVTGGPVSLELSDMPEKQALDIILRTVAGYVAAPRSESSTNLSQYDRILVMPTSSPARPASAPPTPAFQQPQFMPPPPPIEDEDSDDQPAPAVPSNIPQPNPRQPAFNADPRGPVFNTFPPANGRTLLPQPAGAPVPQAPGPATPRAYPTPTAPIGVSTPGMVVPAPVQPGQPVPPGTPTAPARTPDGRIIN